MKINFNVHFKDYKGVELPEKISDVVAAALFAVGTNPDTPVGKEEKYKAFKLSQKIISGEGLTDVGVEDLSFIKQVASHSLTAGAYGQLVDLIEGND
ncbi:hypothetical protein EZS27_001752 [termite gut metagenome]|jgi:hypothetical protein|uniref:Uncharacterized protein n=1 Tax=termite gut metagenome TaxID=433724 RepID=A0A5J4T0K6_9ZZZZ